MVSDTAAILRRHPLFEVVPDQDFPLFLDRPSVAPMATGELLFRQGETASRLLVIADGLVDLLIERDGLPSEPLARLGAGECVGATALMPGATYSASARVAKAGRCAVIDAGRLIAYLDTRFDTTLDMIGLMAGSLRGQVKEITELKLQSTTERLASYLVTLAGPGSGSGPVIVRLPCEKRLLADRLGMEPATLSRAFARLRDAGVETGRGDRVEIADLESLRGRAEPLDPFSGEYAR